MKRLAKESSERLQVPWAHGPICARFDQENPRMEGEGLTFRVGSPDPISPKVETEQGEMLGFRFLDTSVLLLKGRGKPQTILVGYLTKDTC